VAEDIDRLIGQLFEAALLLWEQNDWLAYDQAEENCSVQLYRWCKAACLEDPRFAFFVPHLEWVNLTAAILNGTESVTSANRPDLRLEIGMVGRAVECKRLAPVSPWPRRYVYEGLARFVVDNYGHDESVGYMVGYVQAGTFAEVLAKVNKQVSDHPRMGVAQTLGLLRDNETSSWNRSCHPRASGQPISILHLFVNMSQV
jgi:hypothetical protein